MIEIIVIIITSVFIIYILLPIFLEEKRKMRKVSSDNLELIGKKEVLQRNLADLNFDYQMGKLADDDYYAMQNEYSDEIKNIIKELKNNNQLVNFKVCQECGHRNSTDSKFCSMCGLKL